MVKDTTKGGHMDKFLTDLVGKQIEKAEFMRQHLQPELNQICNLIIKILTRCPQENRERARTLLTSDLNWWINEADIDDRVTTIKSVVSDQVNGDELLF